MRLNQSTKVISGKISKRIHRIGFRWLKNYHVLSFRGERRASFKASEDSAISPSSPSPKNAPPLLPAQKFRIPCAIAVGVSARTENGANRNETVLPCCGVTCSRNSRSIYLLNLWRDCSRCCPPILTTRSIVSG